MSSEEETEPVKRDNKRKVKKEEDGGAGKRAREEHGGAADGSDCCSEIAAADDEEVDEFFAILRRMRVAVSYFGMNDGSCGREIIGCAGKQAPGEFEENRGGGRGDATAVRDESVEENTGFDLNSDPVSEPDPV